MNKYSLRFQDQKLESQYIEKWSQRQVFIFKIGFLLMTVIIIGFDFHAAEMNYPTMIYVYHGIYQVIMIVVYIIVTRYRQHYASRALCIFNIIAALYGSLILIYLGEQTQNLFGLGILLVTFNFIIGQSPDFLDGAISFLICYIIHTFTILTLGSRLGFFIIPMSVACIIISYLTVKTQRMLFLANQKDEVWQTIRENHLSDGVVLFKFDEDTQISTLEQFNQSAQSLFNIYDNASLKHFMRQYLMENDDKKCLEDLVRKMFNTHTNHFSTLLMKFNTDPFRVSIEIFQCRLDQCTFILVLKQVPNAELVKEQKQAKMIDEKLFYKFLHQQLKLMKEIISSKFSNIELIKRNINYLTNMLLLSEINIKPKLKTFNLSQACPEATDDEISLNSDYFLLMQLFRSMGHCTLIGNVGNILQFECLQQKQLLLDQAVVSRILGIVGPRNKMEDGRKFKIYKDLSILLPLDLFH